MSASHGSEEGGPRTEGVPARPTGWQMPSTGEVPEDVERQPSERPPERSFQPTLSRSVWGQVTEVRESAIQYGQGGSETIATVRLERHDAHAGRTSVTIVRLTGGDALGFAHDGDFVEAVGRRKSAYVDARHCINHTTGAVYSGGPVRRLRAVVLALLAFLVLAGGMVFGISRLAEDAERDGRQDFERQSQEMREEAYRDCIQSGSPPEMCETLR